MSKAVKHNTKIPGLTYFIHSGDSIIQLFNVSAQKDDMVTIVGYMTDLDSTKIKVYKSMIKNPKAKFYDKQTKLDANQVHLFVRDFSNIKGKCTINEQSTIQYILYGGGVKSKPRWIKPVVIGAIITGVVAGAVVLINLIKNSLTDSLSS